MTYSTYTEYLKTTKFRNVVNEIKIRSKGICEDCKKEKGVDPHHVRYCKWGEYDTPENLIFLCRECHSNRHRCIRCGQIKLKSFEIKNKLSVCKDCRK